MGWLSRGKPSSGQATPAGWYPDTGGSGQLRYWDGAAWTEHFAPAEQPDDAAAFVASVEARIVEQVRQAAIEPSSHAEIEVDPNPHRDGRAKGNPSSAAKATPFGTPVPPWSEQLAWQEVVGESFHAEAFAALAAEYGHRNVPDNGVELIDPFAGIVPDPENHFDPNAVAVWINGRHLVGHLPRSEAAIWSERLEVLERGAYLEVPARVWIGRRTDWETGETTLGGSVTVRLPPLDGVVPFNDLPDEPHSVLPWGRAVQVTGEELHMDTLRKFSLGSDPRHVAASLHVIEEERRGGATVPIVEVRLDGECVGVLTKATSEQIHDLVSYVASKGRTPIARAVVKGSDLRADVTVHVARTNEVPQKWLDSVVSGS